MVGIDLVDLQDPKLQKRSDRAIQLIAHPADNYKTKSEFWLLWTAKEAIFKSYRTDHRFDPKAIPVQIDLDKLTFHSENISGYFQISENLIIAIAGTNTENVIYRIYKHRKELSQSEDVRARLKDFYKTEYQLDIEVGTDQIGLPIITPDNRLVSFTHHHNFVGFAFLGL